MNMEGVYLTKVSIYQFQNKGKRVHDRMEDQNKNSSVCRNIIIRKLSHISKNDRYIRLFVLVWRTYRCYTVLYRVRNGGSKDPTEVARL